MVDLIHDFVDQYRREYDFYDRAAQLVAQSIEPRLKAAGIRAIVSSRAKDSTRLEDKCRQRESRKVYETFDDIYEDIVDLAGVRIALYFPGDRQRVDVMISQTFEILERVDHPKPGKRRAGKIFDGYSAVHYRVHLKESQLPEASTRYSDARVEMQVASVLMHAWSEVEHDLGYKPLEGALSEEEHAILDELNGLVLTGEIALERLQHAGEVRVSKSGRRFTNHYDLAAHLLGKLATIAANPLSSTGLGRVDHLYELITGLDIATPQQLEPYLEGLHGNLEVRPLADRVIDAILAEDLSRYNQYFKIREQQETDLQSDRKEYHAALGKFLSTWVEFERLMRETIPSEERRPYLATTYRQFERFTASLPSANEELRFLRQMRNQLVHGERSYSILELEQGERTLRAIMNTAGDRGDAPDSGPRPTP